VVNSVVMEQLSTLDAGFLEAEDSDRHVSLAIGALAVIAGPMPAYDSVVAGLAERILSVPRFTQVLRTRPFDLGAPQWVDDGNIDISHHVRRAALPRSGDDAALFRWVAEVMERHLDRDRPLWECWIVERLPYNRWAILMKIHHCIADGIAATNLLARLCDDAEGRTFATKIRAAKDEPTRGGLRLPTLTLNPIDWMAGAWRTSLGVATAAATDHAGRRRNCWRTSSSGGVVVDRAGHQHAALRRGGGVSRRCGTDIREVRGNRQ